MRVNNLDILHHKILVGKSQGGDVSKYENQLHQQLRDGINDKCPVTLDFINHLNANKPIVLIKQKNIFLRFLKWDCCVLKKTRKPILNFFEPIYRIIILFLFASCLIAFIVEAYYA